MARPKLPAAKNWQERKIEDWNSTTFHEYLKYKHKERFSLPYHAGKIPAQSKLIKNLYEEIGKEETKEFIDLCFREYKPKPGYNSINFFFMYKYMNFLIAKAVDNIKRKRDIEIYKQQQNAEVRQKVQKIDLDKIIDNF